MPNRYMYHWDVQYLASNPWPWSREVRTLYDTGQLLFNSGPMKYMGRFDYFTNSENVENFIGLITQEITIF